MISIIKIKRVLGLIFIILSTFSLHSCENKTSKCRVDSKVEFYFKKSISSIKKFYFEEDKADTFFTVDGSRAFLEIVSKIPSKVFKTNFGIYYGSNKDLKEDLENWNNWYAKNECNLNLRFFDEAYNDYIKSKMEEVKKIYPEYPDSLFPYPQTWKGLLEKGIDEAIYE